MVLFWWKTRNRKYCARPACLDAVSRHGLAAVELLGRPEEGGLSTECGSFLVPKIRNNIARMSTTLVSGRLKLKSLIALGYHGCERLVVDAAPGGFKLLFHPRSFL